ncbi:MAG: integrase core domain-containing protein [Rhodomicrobium sp.]
MHCTTKPRASNSMAVEQACRIIESWRLDYNTGRPHTSLRGLTPAEFATRPGKGHNQNGLYL